MPRDGCALSTGRCSRAETSAQRIEGAIIDTAPGPAAAHGVQSLRLQLSVVDRGMRRTRSMLEETDCGMRIGTWAGVRYSLGT
jgi:hypothetical protein